MVFILPRSTLSTSAHIYSQSSVYILPLILFFPHFADHFARGSLFPFFLLVSHLSSMSFQSLMCMYDNIFDM